MCAQTLQVNILIKVQRLAYKIFAHKLQAQTRYVRIGHTGPVCMMFGHCMISCMCKIRYLRNQLESACRFGDLILIEK